MNYYLIATSDDRNPISKAIMWFSKFSLEKDTFDHILLGRAESADLGYIETYDMTLPTTRYMKKFGFLGTPCKIYQINDPQVGRDAWFRAMQSYGNKERYGVLQLITMAWSVVTGRKPITKNQVCSEAIARWIYGREERWMNILTVGRVVEKLEAENYITFVKQI